MSGLNFFPNFCFQKSNIIDTIEATCIYFFDSTPYHPFLGITALLKQTIVFTNWLLCVSFLVSLFLHCFITSPMKRTALSASLRNYSVLRRIFFLSCWNSDYNIFLKIVLWSFEGQWRDLNEGSLWNSGRRFVLIEAVKRLELFTESAY